MGKKQSAKEAAERHAWCNAVNMHEDNLVVRAFLAGVAWARRQGRKAKVK